MHMVRSLVVVVTSWCLSVFASTAAFGQATEPVEVSVERHVLPNGLTLVVHEDHSAPLVSVNVWYHVGSKDEVPGKTGLAHLVEHLMFSGSAHAPGNWFQYLDSWGGTDVNGTTDADRTNFFQTVPRSALDAVLWMESDRMAHLLDVVDEAGLAEQLGVVRNEKLQGESEPYGRVFDVIFEHAYPTGHPYSWPVTGRQTDLDSVTLEDVRRWHQNNYGAGNAVLVIAGDVDPETTRRKVERYFGHVPAGPPVLRADLWIAHRDEGRRVTMQDQVPNARLYKVWNVPEWGSEQALHLDVLSDVLALGSASRLHRRMVRADRVATDVSSFIIERELGSLFVVQVSAVPGVPLAHVEAVLDEELGLVLSDGITRPELERARTQAVSRFVRAIEPMGGIGGRADVLAMSETYTGRADSHERRLEQVGNVTEEDVRGTARDWLASGDLVLEVLPLPVTEVVASEVHEDGPPVPPAPLAPEFPELETGRLTNGLEVVLVPRPAVPLVDVRLIVDAGYSTDARGMPGTTRLALDLLTAGSRSHSAAEIDEALQLQGATFRAASDLDVSVMTLSALRQGLDASLKLFGEIVLRPTFPAHEVERAREALSAEVREEQLDPLTAAYRIMGRLLYGERHPYGVPHTGSGSEVSVRAISRESLLEFHDRWFRPNNATLVVVGATTMKEMIPKLEKAFGDWKPAPVPEKSLPAVPVGDRSAVYVLDRPGAPQTAIVAGHLAPPKANPNELAIEVANGVLGDFGGRINMNLREDKGWSYGASSWVHKAKGQRPFLIMAPVEAERTGESLELLLAELTGVVSVQPVTAEEMAPILSSRALSLPGSWETNRDLLNAITELIEFDLPDDHFRTLSDRLRSLTLDEVNAAAGDTFRPESIVWVVVGDMSVIEPGLRAFAGGNPVFQIDHNGDIRSQVAGGR